MVEMGLPAEFHMYHFVLTHTFFTSSLLIDYVLNCPDMGWIRSTAANVASQNFPDIFFPCIRFLIKKGFGCYNEPRCTVPTLHTLMQNVSINERRVGFCHAFSSLD